MFMVKKTQYFQDVISSQFYLWIQLNPSGNPIKLFGAY